MIVSFPDLETLRLVITSGVVPPAISLAAAAAGVDAQGRPCLQPSVPLPRAVQNALRRLGVQIDKADGEVQAGQVCCWLQLLPVQRDPDAPPLSAQVAVLFELPDAAQLPALVGEILRLGNDRQSFRHFTEENDPRALLRVVGPPYYSLLRALDRDGQASAPRAYLERAPRVWVEIGHTHPLVEQVRPPAGTLLLMRTPREWTFLEDAPFRDIYEVLEFTLPGERVSWTAAELDRRLTVPLRLGAGSHTEPAELWVLREDAVAQLDSLVRESDELLGRLSFAVGTHEGRTTIVVRVRPSKQPPPALVLPGAVPFRPYQKMSNLFLPCGRGLCPPLRRDAVRKLLADDPARITWLYPQDDDGFVPEELPDEAFRPLRDWVDYILDHDRQVLQEWIQATQFDFESFICKDDQSARPKAPPGKQPRGTRRPGGESAESEPPRPLDITVVQKSHRKEAAEDERMALPRARPSELQERLSGLEKRFLSLDGPLHTAERQALWPKMAVLHMVLNHSADAAVCWLNALWEADDPPPRWTGTWALAEAQLPGRELTGPDLDRLLAADSPADLRALAACIVWGAHARPPAPALVQRLPLVRRALEQHEPRLPVRAVWLAWVSLVRLSAGDVLGLARVRDRLLERLLEQGLRPELDLPSFLRFSSQRSSARFHEVRDRVQSLCEAAQRWIDPDHGKEPTFNPTAAYCDLLFAFGLARLGEPAECRKLLAAAADVLAEAADVHQFLFQAYAYRIQQVLEGKPHAGQLPAEQLEYLEHMERFQRYTIDRLRLHSRILEPQEKLDPYRHIKKHTDDLSAELALLPDVRPREELSQRIHRLLHDKRKSYQSEEAQVRILGAALQVAPRLGEGLTIELLDRALETLELLPPQLGLPLLDAVAQLLDHGLFVAAHYDRTEHVQRLVPWFLRVFQQAQREGRADVIDRMAGPCFLGLRKLGLRDETGRLLAAMAETVLEGRSLTALRQAETANWPAVLRSLLHIAGGWMYFGWLEQALPVLNEVRNLLFTEQLPHYERTPLVCLYATTLGQAPVDLALQRVEELFSKLGPITDVYTTREYYARSRLEVVEAVVLAVLSDDFAVGTTARRWLDEDEHLVRRRIHRDLRSMMAQAGL